VGKYVGDPMKRRQFCQFLTAATLIPISVNAWITRGIAQPDNGKRLIVVFLRGAIDGLNLVAPYQETAYYEARPTIALPRPEQEEGLLNLDGYFGLHPALNSLIPFWNEGSLAFVHACGSPATTRSHFDAQDYMESGTPLVKNTNTGWLNRLLANRPKGQLTQAVNLGKTTPRILQGNMAIANLAPGREGLQKLSVDTPAIKSAFDRLYSGQDDLSLAYQQGEQGREIILRELATEMMNASNGAPSPVNFATDARRIAKLMVSDAKTQIAFMSLGGWDTHVNENGILNRNLTSLGEGLSALIHELGALYQDTVIMVMSEFGRTVRENGTSGTDHGHGNVMWLLGRSLRGGKIHGVWPGLEKENLFEERDLAITTDFREIISSILVNHLQLSPAKLTEIFPGYLWQNSLRLL
jgi:uncharacterized protein (DUF1501 family)